jgi:phage terminase Nu1 subunit (DNA packaging protein)
MAEHVSAEGAVTTTQLARLLLLSERRIQQLVRAGVLKHAFDEDTGRELRGRFRFVANLHSYLKYQRNELGRSDDVTELRYLEGRSRRMTALAEAEEMRLGQLKGKLFRAEDIEFVVTQVFTAIKNKLLAVPSRVGRLLIAKTDIVEITTLLKDEVELALTELTTIDRSMFAAQNEAYLASLFPNGAKPNGNGEHDAETEGEGD